MTVPHTEDVATYVEELTGTVRTDAGVSSRSGPLRLSGITRLPPPWRCGDEVRNHFRRLAPLVMAPPNETGVLGVCSVGAGEGRSWIVAGLACALAERGGPVAVVDALTTAPVLHDWFGATGEELAPSADAGAFAIDISVARRPGPALVASAAEAAVQWLRGVATGHSVLVEIDPLRDSSQAATIAPALDGVLLVVAAERERREAVAQAVDSLRRRGIVVRGVVLNRRRRVLPDVVYRWL